MKLIILFCSFFFFVSCSQQAAKGLAVKAISLEMKDISQIQILQKEIVMESRVNYMTYLSISAVDNEGTNVQRSYCVCIRKKLKLRNMFVARIDTCTQESLDQSRDRCKFPNDIDKARAKRLGLPMEKDLYELALRGDAEGLFSALKTGEADVNRKYRWGNFGLYAPLHGAVQNGHFHLIDILLKREASINVMDHFGNTPLNINNISEDIAKVLIAKKADINIQNKRGESPIFNFVRDARLSLISLLIEKKADLTIKNEFNENILNILIESFHTGKWGREDFLKYFKLLLSKKVSPNQKSTSLFKGRDFPIVVAVLKNDMEMLEALIFANVNLNVRSNNNHTPLMIALMNRNKKIVEFLVTKGADVNLGDGEDMNALFLAIPDLEMVKYLLAQGFKLNYANIHGIIRRAEDMESKDIVSFLKETAKEILKEDQAANDEVLEASESSDDGEAGESGD